MMMMMIGTHAPIYSKLLISKLNTNGTELHIMDRIYRSIFHILNDRSILSINPGHMYLWYLILYCKIYFKKKGNLCTNLKVIFQIICIIFAFKKYFLNFGYQLVTQIVQSSLNQSRLKEGPNSDVNLVAPEAQTDPILSVSLHFYEQNLDQALYQNVPKIALKLPVSSVIWRHRPEFLCLNMLQKSPFSIKCNKNVSEVYKLAPAA